MSSATVPVLPSEQGRRSLTSMSPLIESYLVSGERQVDFCTRVGIKLCTFQYWLRQYRARAASESSDASSFVALELSESVDSPCALWVRDVCGHEYRFGSLPPVSYVKALLC